MSWEIATVVALFGVSYSLLYLSVNSKKHGPMQLLFLFVGIFTLIAQVNLAALLAEDAGKTTIAAGIWPIYIGLISMLIVVGFYYILKMVFGHLEELAKQKATGNY